ncbi:MAG: FABP family protein [Gammaproteobacteria bacterium]|nr:FABP family protein [Gammaproteobacteria bacterium]
MKLEVKSSEHLLLLLAEQLVGNWKGNGTVQFPTMDTFSYQESLGFIWDEERLTLFYQQLTRIQPRDEPSHAESGYLLIGPENIVQWISVQSAGRCEVLDCNNGLQDFGDGEIEIIFESSAIINDPRMISSRRRLRFDVDGTYLKYQQDMRTTAHGVLSNHLIAKLTKSGEA